MISKILHGLKGRDAHHWDQFGHLGFQCLQANGVTNQKDDPGVQRRSTPVLSGLRARVSTPVLAHGNHPTWNSLHWGSSGRGKCSPSRWAGDKPNAATVPGACFLWKGKG